MIANHLFDHNGKVMERKDVCDAVSDNLLVERFQQNLPLPLHGKLYLEVENYFKTGNCQINSNPATNSNPTFLHSKTGRGSAIACSACPFNGYLPLPLKELEESDSQNGTIWGYCRGVLKKRLEAYRERMKDVKIYFHLCDAMEFCYEDSPQKFDLIDTSTLADDVGLVNLLNGASRKLRSAQSFLFTESIQWHERQLTAEQYVKETLCCSTSLIPTMYGLRLKDSINLGSKVPPFYENNGLFPWCRLCWMKALPFEGVPLVLTQPLEESLNRLNAACFPIPLDSSSNLREQCGISSYTPLTFSYVVSDLIRRGGIRDVSAVTSKLFSVPRPVFRKALETRQAWMNNRPVWRVEIDIPLVPVENILSVTGRNLILRLMLIRSSYFRNSNLGLDALRKKIADLDSPDVHFFDNMDMVNKKSNGKDYVQLSFLLQDRSLLKTHKIVVVDLESLTPVSAGYAADFSPRGQTAKIFGCPFPFSLEPSPPASSASSTIPRLIAETCEESEEGYTIRLKMRSSSS